ncbi:MAG: cytochrome c family protein [Phenylobacterium sp.]|uniref:c-type cytochrome n=1 Tax=Phenylobacterium sp. TaxID=1871053 RepID=UPI002735711B|nr:cytochrome c family protein [Phenylobacterium sp.]MDP3746430.1 cytochrome c family protein [Phenylobacterium sp.]
MSDLTFNKVAGAVLATGLAIVGLREISTGVFATHEVEKPGYAIAVVEDTGGGATAEAPIDWGSVLPTADLKAGEAVFAKCKSCHTIEAGGPNGTGPNLNGVLGKKPGAHAGFAYSSGMTEHGGAVGTWQFADLSEFLKAPQKHIAGTKMTFVGLKKPEERINLIAYLNAQGSNLPIPAPNPVVAAAPAAEGAAPAEAGAPTAAPAGAPANAAAIPVTPAAQAAAPARKGGELVH